MAAENEVVEPSVEDQMDAGFNAAKGVAPVAEEKPAEVEVKADAPEVKADPAPEPEKVEEEPEEKVVLNQSEVKALLAKLDDLDKLKTQQREVFGRIGSIHDTVNKLKEAKANGKPIELSDEDLAELNDFGELKSSLSSVLRKVLSKAGSGTAEVDLEPLKKEFREQQEAKDREHQKQLLSVMHEDWQEVVQGDGFRLWLTTQPEDFREKINNSWDALEIGKALRSYKATLTPKAAPAASPAPAPNKKSRLEAAVTPRGTPSIGGVQLTPEQLMEQGFRNARPH